MTAADLSSTYSHEVAPEMNHTVKDTGAHVKLFENLLQHDLEKRQWVKDRTPVEWIQQVFKNSAVFEGVDELIWGKFLACVYKDPNTNKISTLIFDKLGITHFNPVDTSSKSQYHPAVENLTAKDKESNVKKCIAVSLLQKFAQLTPEELSRLNPNGLKFDYDQTHAGDLASRCKLIDFCTPEEIGKQMLSLGLLQSRSINSILLDVVYERKESLTEKNNRLVFHLGEQLEQLFNPLTEYSPEQTEYTYKPPEQENEIENDDSLVKPIIDELIKLQTNLTLTLVEFLQGFLIKLRIKVLNEEIEGLSTVKLNRLFPPTIDEVTRINCIFLDSLKSAAPFGCLEILKACSVTIPYFYKAYTRHEAATKNFTKDFKLFLQNFDNRIPRDEIYSNIKIEGIINGPKEKLLNLKVIINQLYKTQIWTSTEAVEAQQYYDNITQAIESFGKMTSQLSSYNTRVFTPSGKILTELAKGWPEELQYKWLKRRVVGVYDIVANGDISKREILVIFSDYVVFLEVINGDHYYAGDNNNKPRIADILMNSLINEVPLPTKIPKLKVHKYCYIDQIIVTVLREELLRFDAHKSSNSFSLTCSLFSNSVSAFLVADLVAKAKILEKETAFHLFRAEENNNIIYSTAHELDAYKNENLKSPFSLFLNMEPSRELLAQNKLHVAIFAKFINNIGSSDVQLDVLTSDGRTTASIVPPEEMVLQIFRELTHELPICYSSIYSPLLPALLSVNEQLVQHVFNNVQPIEKVADSKKIDSQTFTQDHEKKKSFGTITTFRSYASDYKNSTSGKLQPRETTSGKLQPPETTSSKLQPPETTSGKRQSPETTTAKQEPFSSDKSLNKNHSNALKVDTPKRTTKISPKKRKSVLQVLKGIFGNKDHTSHSRKKNEKLTGGTKPSRPITNQKISGGAAKNKTISLDTKVPRIRDEHTATETRVTSVIRHPDFASEEVKKSEDVTKDISKESVQKNVSQQDMQFGDLLKDKTEETEPNDDKRSHTYAGRENSDRDLEIPLKMTFGSNPSQCTETSASRGLYEGNVDNVFEKTESDVYSSANFYKGHSRQSQLFNEDLYGELATEAAEKITDVDSETAIISQRKTNDIEEGSVHSREPSQITEHLSDVHDPTDKHWKTSTGISNTGHYTSLRDDESATKQNKNQIFPFIPIQEPPKINFVRSSSFVELFHGMRLILDENDAQYNWRRLSGETSLNENHALQTENKNPNPHVFKSIAQQPGKDLRPTKNNDQVEMKDAELAMRDLQLGSKDIESIQITENPNDSQNLNEYEQNSEPQNVAELILKPELSMPVSNSSTPFLAPPFLAPPNFKVLRMSPTRIVNKPTKKSEQNSIENNMTCDFSISSELNVSTNKRWIELKLPSQEDLQDCEFYRQAEHHTNVFSKEALEIDDHSSLSEVDKEVNESSRETSIEDPPKQIDTEALIEDMEFSSFHMTFDASLTNDDPSRLDSPSEQLDDKDVLVKQSSIIKPTQEEPVLYRLPRDILLTSRKISNLRGDGGGGRNVEQNSPGLDDDPIWVSPSKIDFYDLSRVSEASAVTKKKLLPHAHHCATNNTPPKDIEDTRSIRELSYAYLASFVDSDQESERFDDRPVRLHFCE